jgi:sugar lactone lactonase YvrE
VVPAAGSHAPAGSVIYQFWQNGHVVTEAGVAATAATTTARIFVDNVGSSTGVAVANAGSQAADVTFTLLDRYGEPEQSAARLINARGQLAIFAHELFPGLSDRYTGVMEITSPVAIHPVTLKLTVNERAEPVLTTLPVADLTQPAISTLLVFPQIATAAGFSTRLILINGSRTMNSLGTLAFYGSDGIAMSLPLGAIVGKSFRYELAAGESRQLYPGSSAGVARVVLVDPVSHAATSEFLVTAGRTQRARLLVLDTLGQPRDDFELRLSSLRSDVAAVDRTGLVTGKAPGYSTLILESPSGPSPVIGTITVVALNSGPAGFGVTGITQDQARRVYLANTTEHTVLWAENLSLTPEIYAGVRATAGLKNALRRESLFRNPAFVALNQSNGDLYVSDAANNVIRRVPGSARNQVETRSSGFNNPQGIALDRQGRLWIADTGSHTIRRIETDGQLVTIAGRLNSPGAVNGARDVARFHSPAGIAIETETSAQLQERDRLGLPPPPVQVLVADTGNGLIRRVRDDGVVETIQAGVAGVTLSSRLRALETNQPPVLFSTPVAVAVDPLGTIYVSEAGSKRVRALLQNGDVVAAAPTNTFQDPRGLAIAQNGRLIVADRSLPVQEIVYGQPSITRITPVSVNSRTETRLTVIGKNFPPDAIVIVAGVVIGSKEIHDSETISFTAPGSLPSGRTTVTVQTRGGIAQFPLLVEAVSTDALSTGSITTLAGGSTFAGDGTAASSASLVFPKGAVTDNAGNLFIVDSAHDRIRRVDARTGIMTTVAGSGRSGFSGENELALTASMAFPGAVAIDAAGNLYIADTFSKRIRKVSAATGIITTFAGDGGAGVFGRFGGDGGPAASASLGAPRGSGDRQSWQHPHCRHVE